MLLLEILIAAIVCAFGYFTLGKMMRKWMQEMQNTSAVSLQDQKSPPI